jgi:hypothetical protein
MHVCLGTDKQGELFFEKLFDRAELMKLGPVPIHIWMKPLPRVQDSDYATVVVSRFVIEQLISISAERVNQFRFQPQSVLQTNPLAWSRHSSEPFIER